jgi:hypothetical protein
MWVGLVVVLVVLLATGAYLLGRSNGDAAAGGPGAAAGSTAPTISWSIVGGSPVPASLTHGPRNTASGLATGFSHDTLGAALAAMNISFRLTSEAGPQIYEATARSQCFGDVDTTLEQIRNSFSAASEESTTPSELWYKIASGDPSSDLVLISIAVKTPQSVERGGYAKFDRTMRWIDNDWKMQIPPLRPSIISSVSDYTLLGRPNV